MVLWPELLVQPDTTAGVDRLRFLWARRLLQSFQDEPLCLRCWGCHSEVDRMPVNARQEPIVVNHEDTTSRWLNYACITTEEVVFEKTGVCMDHPIDFITIHEKGARRAQVAGEGNRHE
jgi:hypothetical protein